MTTSKKFGRPTTFEVEQKARAAAAVASMRVINVSREGGPLEGAYAAASSRDEMRLQPYESHHRRVLSDGAKTWLGLVLFWSALCMMLSTWVL